jgi:hypothetical protein
MYIKNNNQACGIVQVFGFLFVNIFILILTAVFAKHNDDLILDLQQEQQEVQNE